MTRKLAITILMDNPGSWFVPYAKDLVERFEKSGHRVTWVEKTEDLPEGEIAFFLSVEGIVPPRLLERHTHNIVIHGSKLPEGKGWSPLTWQILEGKDRITVSLFEAAEKVDSGVIYDTEEVEFDGGELIEELRDKEAAAICDLAVRFVEQYPPREGKVQAGVESFYPRRKPADSELDVHKSILENFNILRVVDNERYPAYFKHKGHTYILKIYKKD